MAETDLPKSTGQLVPAKIKPLPYTMGKPVIIVVMEKRAFNVMGCITPPYPTQVTAIFRVAVATSFVSVIDTYELAEADPDLSLDAAEGGVQSGG